jgi:hypothetical protein
LCSSLTAGDLLLPRFFFDIHDGINIRDDVGQILPDLDAAKVEAIRLTSHHATDPKAIASSQGALIVEVRDTSENVLLKARLSLNAALG